MHANDQPVQWLLNCRVIIYTKNKYARI